MLDSKILIVDDEEDNREAVKQYLELDDFTNILTASNGEQALEISQREKPGLIILDVSLGAGSIDGMEVLRKIKGGISVDSKVYMLSAHKEDYESRAKELGANGFWTKPLMIDTISERIQAILV